MYSRSASEFILIQMLQFLACGLVGVRFSVTSRESWQECWNYIAGPTRTIKSREGKSHNEWTPLSRLQRAALGLVRPTWTRTNRCHVLWGETKGRTRTKPHKATDINPSAVPLQLFLYDDVLPLNPLTVKSATIRNHGCQTKYNVKRHRKYSKDRKASSANSSTELSKRSSDAPLLTEYLTFLGNCPTWLTNFFQCIYLFIVLYMFRACHAHHQEKQIVSIQLLVIVTLQTSE